MRSMIEFWKGFKQLPSAWLLLVQLLILVLSVYTNASRSYQILTWLLGVSALLIIAKVIRQTPTFTLLGLTFVTGAFVLSFLMLIGFHSVTLQIFAHSFTLIAWGFAFLYSICQLVVPQSFQNPNHVADYQSWLDLLFISFSLQSATGLSDLIPVAPAARVISMLQMFCGVMYFALIVSRMIALQYIENKPKS